MKQKLLVTGARGFLGGRMAAAWAHTYEVIALTRTHADLTQPQAVLDAVTAAQPDILLHCAAMSDTAAVQAQPEAAYAANVEATLHLARACLATGTRFVYMSSDQVYNGCNVLHPLSETAPLAPETVYAKQKLEAEQALQALLPDAVGLRLTWLYDMPMQGQKANGLLYNLLRTALRGDCVSFPVRQLRGVTWVQELVRQLPEILALPGGIYNAGSTAGSEETAYETAVFAARALGAHAELVQPDLLRYSAHVCNLNMDTHKIGNYGVQFAPSLAGIEACLRAYGWKNDV